MTDEVGKQENEKDEEEEKESNANFEEETGDTNSSNVDRDQDSDIFFMNVTDEESYTAEIEEEDWIEYMKRSTDEVMQRMKKQKSNAGSKLTEEWNGD